MRGLARWLVSPIHGFDNFPASALKPPNVAMKREELRDPFYIVDDVLFEKNHRTNFVERS